MNESPPRTARFWALALGVALGFALALAIAGREVYFRTEILEQGDLAANAIRIGNAKHLAEYRGNYSRFEFDHPGPAFFYVEAAGEAVLRDFLRLVPSPYNAHVLASIFLQCLFLGLAVAIVDDHFRWRFLAPLLLVAAAVHFSCIPGALVSTWPPHVLLAPCVCFLAACASVASGRLRHLPVMVVAGGFLFHGHVAQALFVGVLGLLALGGYWRVARRAGEPQPWRAAIRSHRRLAWFCTAGVVLFLSPLVIDVATRGAESNVATIVRRFLIGPEEARKTLLQSVLYLASFASYAQEQETVLQTVGPATWEFFGRHWVALAAWALLLGGPAIGCRLLARRLGENEGRFLRACHAVLGVTALLCLAWGVSQIGPMHHFNGFFYHGVYFFGLVPALAILAWWLERWPFRAATVPVYGAAVAIVFLGVPRPQLVGDATGQSIRRTVDAALQGIAAGAPVILSFEQDRWGDAAAVAVHLGRTGHPFYLTPKWNFMFGAEHSIERLGAAPEDRAKVWWVGAPAAGGQPLNEASSLYLAPPALDPRGVILEFGPGEDGFRHAAYGLSVSNVDSATTTMPRTLFLLGRVASDRDVRVTFDIASNVVPPASPTQQPAEIRFNGETVGRLSAGERTTGSVVVPRDLWNRNPGEARLEIVLPDAVRRQSFRRPASREWYGWRIWSIRLDPAG